MNLLRAKAQFYLSLATLQEAGLPITKAYRQRHPPPFRQIAPAMAAAIEAGTGDLGTLMERYPRVFTALECQFARIGQETGRLDTVYRSLSEWFATLARLRAQLISSLMYPGFLYHSAALLIPFVSVIMERCTVPQAVVRFLVMIGLFWAVTLFCFAPRRDRRSRTAESGRPPRLVDELLLAVPVFGTLILKLDYARFFKAYGLALNSGLSVVRATHLGADTCRNTVLAASLHAVAAEVDRGNDTFTQAFARARPHGAQAARVLDLLETGEGTGQAAEMALRLGAMFSEEAEEQLKRVALVVSTLVYLSIVIYVAIMVLSFWAQLIQRTNEFL